MRAGRFGAYVNWGKVNATIPKSMSAEAITLEEALELIAEREGMPAKTTKAPPRKAAAKAREKPAAPPKAAKKAAAKKPLAKAAAKPAPAKKAAIKKAAKKSKRSA